MDLRDREEHRIFRAEVQDFVAECAPRAPKERMFSYRIEPKKFADDVKAWQRLLVERGYACREVPKEYGGFGAESDHLKSRIIAEEFFAADLPQGLMNQGISMFVPTLLAEGTEEQKKTWIEPTIKGDLIWCQGYSEPGAGSDLASLKTRGDEDGADFLINGQKIWTSWAHVADMIFCLVRTEPDAPKHKGISYIIFPMNTPGIDIRPLQTMTGHPSFNEVFFTDVRVPQANVVGGRGNGWAVANNTLVHERGFLANANLSQERLNRIEKLLLDETVDGRRLMEDRAFSDRYFRLKARVHAMHLHEMRLASMMQKGEKPGLAGMVCKWIGCELNFELDTLAIDAFGEMGVMFDGIPDITLDGVWQQLSMYDLGLIIGGGTAQIQKNIIAERGLGMPREPKPAAG